MDRKSALFGDAMLAFFDFTIEKLFDFSALQTDEVIVVIALIKFEHRLVAVEVMADQQACLFKLGQHAVNRGQTDIQVFFGQHPVDFFGRHVALVALLEQVENFQSGQGGLETNVFEIGRIAQWGLQIENANTL